MIRTRLYSIANLVKNVEHYQTFLSSDEIEKSARMLDKEKSMAYIACRGMLRSILSEQLNQSPEKIRFNYNKYGKPSISSQNLYFNCSHSHDLLLIALDNDHSCGVDIEFVNNQRNVDRLISKVLSKSENEIYMSMSDSIKKTEFFYKVWTIKEAITKERGTGIIASLNKINPRPKAYNRYAYEDLIIYNKSIEGYTLSLATKNKEELLNFNDLKVI